MTTFTAASGVHFLGHFSGLLKKKFRLTRVNEKDREILTLANLESGYIRKFVVNRVDEQSLVPSSATAARNGGPPRPRRENRSAGTALAGVTLQEIKSSSASSLQPLAKIGENETPEQQEKNNLKKDPELDVLMNNVKNNEKGSENGDEKGVTDIDLQQKTEVERKLSNGDITKKPKDSKSAEGSTSFSNGKVLNLSSPKPKRKKKSKTKTSRFSLGTAASSSSSSDTEDTDDEIDLKKRRKQQLPSRSGVQGKSSGTTSFSSSKPDKGTSKTNKSKESSTEASNTMRDKNPNHHLNNNNNNNNNNKNHRHPLEKEDIFEEAKGKVAMPGNQKDDPGVCNPAFAKDADDDDDEEEEEEEEEDEHKSSRHSRGRRGRGAASHKKKSRRVEAEESDDSESSRATAPKDSPASSPRIPGFRSLRNSPSSHRSGMQSGRSSVSSVRKGILKKSGSCVTINLEMAQQNGHNKSYPNSIVEDPSDLADGQSFPNDHQRSINRVKFLLESGKPDTIHGSYDDIRLEMNRIDRADSTRSSGSESSDRGYGGFSKSSRKYMFFCGGLLLLTTAVIVGSFVGTGKLTQMSNRYTGGASALAGRDSATSVTTYVKNAMEVTFKIVNETFTQALGSADTQAYQNLSKLLEKQLKDILVTSEIEFNGNSMLEFRIIKFDPGSIIPTFRIGWHFIDPNTTLPPPLNRTLVRSRLEHSIAANNGFIDKYAVPVDTLNVDRVIDVCANNVMGCSDDCVFSHNTLRFSCVCPDFKILINRTTCVNHSAITMTTTTTTEVYLDRVFSHIFSKIGPNTAYVSVKKEQKESLDETDDIAKETAASNETSSSTTSTTSETPTTSTSLPSTTTTTTTTTPVPTTVSSTAATINDTSEVLTFKSGEAGVSNATAVEVPASAPADTEDTLENPLIVGETGVLDNATGESMTTSTISPSSTEATTTTTPPPPLTEIKPHPETEIETDEHVPAIGQEEPLPEISPNVTKGEVPLAEVASNQISLTAESVPTTAPTTTVPPQVTEASMPASTTSSQSTSQSEATKGSDGSVASTMTASAITPSTLDPVLADVTSQSSPPALPESSSESELNITTPTTTTTTTTTIRPSTPLLPVEVSSTESTGSPISSSPVSVSGVNEGVSSVSISDEATESTTHLVPSTTAQSTVATESHPPVILNEIISSSATTSAPPQLPQETPVASPSPVASPTQISTSSSVLLDNELVPSASRTPEVYPAQETTSTHPISSSQSEKPMEFQNETVDVMAESARQPATVEVVTSNVVPLQDVNPANKSPPLVRTSTSTTTPPSVLLPGAPAEGSLGLAEDGAAGPGSMLDQSVAATVANASLKETAAGDINATGSDPELLWSFNNVVPSTPATTSSTTSTTPAPTDQCTEAQHPCDGRCLSAIQRCDAVPDCVDGSDEKNCVKNSCFLNFQCWSGDCVARRLVCDGVTDCPGGDDEQGCNTWSCLEDEFRCTSTFQESTLPATLSSTTSPPSDGVSETSQALSSIGPPPVSVGGPCLPLALRCDGQPDCFNRTDERGCLDEDDPTAPQCGTDQFKCPEGWCIPKGWRCDGMADCQHGEDERDCECGGLDEAACTVGGCVPTFHLCDGLRQCPDGSDEWSCVRVRNATRRLEVRSGVALWRSVCGDGWTSAWSDLVCEQLVGGTSVSTEVRRVKSPVPSDNGVVVPRPRVSLAPDASPRSRTPLQYALSHDQCSSDALVHLTCHHDECGDWSYSVKSSASPKDGEDEPESVREWPSLAILLQIPPAEVDSILGIEEAPKAPTHPCTASILTPMWLITSYSCLLSQPGGTRPDSWAVVAGKGAPNTAEDGAQLKHVGQVRRYPGAKRQEGLWTGDLALLRLVSPLSLNRHTRPVCVATGDAPSTQMGPCVLASWKPRLGHEDSAPYRPLLHDLPVADLMNLTTCNATHYRGRLSRAHMCAELGTLQPAPCHGDEGSPLMCLTSDGSWQLEGLLSHHSNCGTSKHPAIFTATRALSTWILNTIGMGFGVTTMDIAMASTTMTVTAAENTQPEGLLDSSPSDGHPSAPTEPEQAPLALASVSAEGPPASVPEGKSVEDAPEEMPSPSQAVPDVSIDFNGLSSDVKVSPSVATMVESSHRSSKR